ncbi:Uncharacterized protein DBV15_10103 [Temnothorax longispinosus]|uniref:Uncharacterized protein n=1 Tax=Temnothorax longispinosus TaxID=300112 RepID=A0A4S2JC07_9HYME|nr:Uncharacterized protein DBV15_10103 [Temnothorax longispinosus]
MSTDGDLAFKLASQCRNLVEREIDSVSSCAINLDWDFNIGKRRQHQFVGGAPGDAGKFHPATPYRRQILISKRVATMEKKDRGV